MNWNRVIVAALVGGVVMWLGSFVIHGLLLGATYTRYPDVFAQAQSNPLWFLLIEILVALPAAMLFSKTRECWSAGLPGGLVFGFWIGLLGFFPQFFDPLVIEGFPYYLAWCWGGANLMISLLLGAVLGAMIRRA